VVEWAQRRRKLPRALTTALILLLGAAVAIILIAYLAPFVFSQLDQLIRRLPRYWDSASKNIGPTLQSVRERVEGLTVDLFGSTTQPATQPDPQPVEVTVVTPTTQPIDPAAVATQPAGPLESMNISVGQVTSVLITSLNLGLTVVGATLSLVTYLILAALLIVFSFFMFSWKFQSLKDWGTQLIPKSNRERTLEILGKMDRSVSAFIRGRLIQSFVVGLVLTVGWGIAGVPYFVLLGLLGGLLNLIPYAAITTWPLAVMLAWVDRVSGGSGFSVWMVLIWPSAVYMIAQALDGWVVEPLVQGQATELDPLAILLAVLVGGTLLGLFGMILAIPTAACVKILMQQVVVPRIRSWADRH
jgi:predicted PurR-regulated permease PerM